MLLLVLLAAAAAGRTADQMALLQRELAAQELARARREPAGQQLKRQELQALPNLRDIIGGADFRRLAAEQVAARVGVGETLAAEDGALTRSPVPRGVVLASVEAHRVAKQTAEIVDAYASVAARATAAGRGEVSLAYSAARAAAAAALAAADRVRAAARAPPSPLGARRDFRFEEERDGDLLKTLAEKTVGLLAARSLGDLDLGRDAIAFVCAARESARAAFEVAERRLASMC